MIGGEVRSDGGQEFGEFDSVVMVDRCEQTFLGSVLCTQRCEEATAAGRRDGDDVSAPIVRISRAMLYGGITAIQHVLPGMLSRGTGTVLVTTGASSGPLVHTPFANIAAASGALRNWVLNLHAALTPTGVYAAHVAIAAWIGNGGPQSQPDTIADTYWDMHSRRADAERLYVEELAL